MLLLQRKESRRGLWPSRNNARGHQTHSRTWEIQSLEEEISLKKVQGHSNVWFKLVFLEKTTTFNGRLLKVLLTPGLLCRHL